MTAYNSIRFPRGNRLCLPYFISFVASEKMLKQIYSPLMIKITVRHWCLMKDKSVNAAKRKGRKGQIGETTPRGRKDFGKRLGGEPWSTSLYLRLLSLGDIRRLRNPVMHCTFSRDCEARHPLHNSKFSLFLPPSWYLTLTLTIISLHPSFLRRLAFSTNGHNYVHVPIHNPHCQPRLSQSSFDKVHHHEQPYSRCSRPISHFPTLAILFIIVYLPLSRFSQSSHSTWFLSFIRFSSPLSFPSSLF